MPTSLLFPFHRLLAGLTGTTLQNIWQKSHVRRNRNFPNAVNAQEGEFYQTRFLPPFLLLLPVQASPLFSRLPALPTYANFSTG